MQVDSPLLVRFRPTTASLINPFPLLKKINLHFQQDANQTTIDLAARRYRISLKLRRQARGKT